MLRTILQKVSNWIKNFRQEDFPMHAPISNIPSEIRSIFPSETKQYKTPTTVIIAWDGGDRPHEQTLAEFERSSSIQYLTHLEFKNAKILRAVQKQCRHLIDNDMLNTETTWLGSYYRKQVQAGYVNDVIIKWISEDIGYGTFARKDIEAFEYIGEYTGVVKRKRFFFPKINDYCFFYPSSYKCFLPYLIDSEEKGNITRFINHSDEGNCDSHAVLVDDLLHIIVRAVKKISKGEQIVYDYGERYWRHRTKLSN